MTAQNQPATHLYSLRHLAIIEVNGEDAGRFLQGQLTCNINELSSEQASVAAFCNAKGRMISTLLVIRTQLGFFLILPASLLNIAIKKLQMYILRAKVQLTTPENLTLIGITGHHDIPGITLPCQDFSCQANDDMLFIKMPLNRRFLCIAPLNKMSTPPFSLLHSGPLAEWRFHDISGGFPWFEVSQSEQYIPQMLNIDQLGGVSFNKGCYTGQEIVARTHYLGKTKRQLYLAETEESLPRDSDYAVLDAQSLEKCGDVLNLESCDATTRLLVVLQTVDDNPKNFILNDQKHTPIKLIPCQ
ncbi:YgfZ/GcvT domain-containing protein [Methylomonas methanica]|uniref:Folate-binding protein YgfZ n=1 Tax=Methylomonas methanica (strain DSM 25384 / MC09) TaxID=857087 RepID=G0A4B9_METMM|nr:folate-binding protein YgfZ [Methylomonas methanica]AEG00335.1 folate-binding protein YgfZ [Methylomonas methanica MC09]